MRLIKDKVPKIRLNDAIEGYNKLYKFLNINLKVETDCKRILLTVL